MDTGWIERAVSEAAGDRPVLLAIDGKSASGKSTLGRKLNAAFGGSLFHMDDFFLRPEQRTKERLSEIGGNVDYERFKEEVLDPVRAGQEVICRRYDCKGQRLLEPVRVPFRRFTIVEGSYSQHPYFGDCYDFRIVLDIGEEEQLERIRRRNGETMLRRFKEEWIPKENQYLTAFSIAEKADFVCRVV